MEISSRFVGATFKAHQVQISWRDTMNYAAAADDPNPLYFDDDRPAGVLVHPMFCVAVTWPILERMKERLTVSDFPHHLLATQVHYTEHLEFHRPIRPGDFLTIEGAIAAILPHRAGTRVVIRLDAFDKNRSPVFTEHTGTLLRGVRCSDGGRGKESLPPLYALSDNSRTIWQEVIPIDPLRPFLYDGCTGIFFPIHTSKRFAHQVGLPDIILQGTATLAFAVRELINREAAGNPAALRTLYARFTGMVLPGGKIHVQLIGKTREGISTSLHFVVQDQDGNQVISQGYARLDHQL